jgi:hypothetical protein
MPAAIVLLALAAGAWGLGNGFVYDDIAIIAEDARVRRLDSPWTLWTSAYWPSGLLYRPVTTQVFALEWAAGGGRPFVFHLVSLLLTVATVLLFWRLARRVLPSWAAFVAAGLFAVHPVHVEVTANIVGQAELLATCFALVALERYLVWRTDGSLTPLRRAGLAALTLLAILSKETGYTVPVLLAAAELTVVRASTGRSWSWRDATSTLSSQMLMIVTAILIRILVLGPTPGAGPSLAFWNVTAIDRVVGMLAIVPHWFRLLLWPAHLQAEYGPPAFAISGAMSAAHYLGLAILASWISLIAATSRRSPAASLGLAWIGIAIFPVSNLLTPTGVVLAERTLFLPSAGMMLALGAAWAWLQPRAAPKLMLRAALAMAAGGLLALGVWRSAERTRAWHDQDQFMARLMIDAPTVARSHKLVARHMKRTNRGAEAEAAWRRAYELFEGDPEAHEELGQIYRASGRCREAIPVFASGLQKHADRTTLRSRYIECLLVLGDTMGARNLALNAVAQGYPEFEQTVRRLSSSP